MRRNLVEANLIKMPMECGKVTHLNITHEMLHLKCLYSQFKQNSLLEGHFPSLPPLKSACEYS